VAGVVLLVRAKANFGLLMIHYIGNLGAVLQVVELTFIEINKMMEVVTLEIKKEV